MQQFDGRSGRGLMDAHHAPFIVLGHSFVYSLQTALWMLCLFSHLCDQQITPCCLEVEVDALFCCL